MVRVLCAILLLCSSVVRAEESINVAVTSSFKPVLETLSKAFFASTGIKLNVSSASTGVLYQQIALGAPFDVFFAADDVRPQLLAKELSLPEGRTQAYAVGQLVLVSLDDSVKSLEDLAAYTGKIVIANPTLAPYGQAAETVLDFVGFEGDLVLANNVAQARQYLKLRLTSVGIIAASMSEGFPRVVEIEQARYDEIQQQMVVLNPSGQVLSLVGFLSSSAAQTTITNMGYLLPGRP